MPCVPNRAPLSQQNTFEFKPMGQQQMQQPAKVMNPFTAGLRQPVGSADSTRIVDQVMHSPEPVTPASITSESRGGPAGPPLTTLASLSKMSPSDSDTVTPMANMHTSHVPLSTYSGSPPVAKKASKIVWQDIFMWKEPLQTTTIFIAGLALFALVTFAAYGAHKMTLMSGVSVSIHQQLLLRGDVLQCSCPSETSATCSHHLGPCQHKYIQSPTHPTHASFAGALLPFLGAKTHVCL